jgi:hypothetical protein
MVILKRKTIPKEILVRANTKGWVNGTVMEDWMTSIFQKRKSAFFKKPKKEHCLLIFDSCTALLKPEVKEAVEKYTKLALIPAGLTKHLQPLVISVNKSFKTKLRNSWDEWMLDFKMISLTKGGNRRKATFSTICGWIVKAWTEITPEIIKNGFKKAGVESYETSGFITENQIEEEMEVSSDASDNIYMRFRT